MKELYGVLIESLRKQAFSVILLICACAGLWIIRQDDRKEFMIQIAELNKQISECSRAREDLKAEVAVLRERVFHSDPQKPVSNKF